MTATSPHPTNTGGRTRIATVITETTAPAILAVPGLIVVAVHSVGTGAGVAWGGFAALLVTGIPLGYVAKGIKRGKWADHHIGGHSQRAVPLLIASASVVVAAVLLVLVDAPRDLIALVLGQLVGLLVVLVVSRWWNISIHTAVAGGVLVVLFGPGALVGIPIFWSPSPNLASSWMPIPGPRSSPAVTWALS